MLTLTHVSLATVEELFRYKADGFTLEAFPGYTDDQWGIKAHNRPWIDEVGDFRSGQKVIEVGGAFSLLPKYLSDRYGVESWIADDFGASSGETVWSRWGDPSLLPGRYPTLNYTFEKFGTFSDRHPTAYFDRIFTVSTLEHIPQQERLDVIRDMNRCLKPGGRQMHTIDIEIPAIRRCLLASLADRVQCSSALLDRFRSEMSRWILTFRATGIQISARVPDAMLLLSRSTLVESPDVVYTCYPPNNSAKSYCPTASLLMIVEDL